MTFKETFSIILVQTIANIVSNLAWFILFVWGFKLLAREIGNGVRTLAKNVPLWLEQYDKVKTKQRAIDLAMSMKRL